MLFTSICKTPICLCPEAILVISYVFPSDSNKNTLFRVLYLKEPFNTESVFQKEEDYLKFACEMPGKIFDENKDILKGVLIFIDDFELIYQLDTDVLSFFRYLSHAQKGIAYVFSGNMDGSDFDFSLMSAAFGGRILPFELGPFSFKTTKSLLMEKADYLNFSEDGFKQFYECTSGIPRHVNVFTRLLTSDAVLDKEEVMLEFDKYLYYLADSSRKEWYKSTVQEKKVVVSLIDKPLRRVDIARKLEVSSGALGRSLNSLKHDLIELKQNHYHIKDNIFRLWLKSEYDKKGVFPFR